jgi:hypothetical protein
MAAIFTVTKFRANIFSQNSVLGQILTEIYNPSQMHTIPLTPRLLNGYKMYSGLEFSRTFLAGTEKQSGHAVAQ